MTGGRPRRQIALALLAACAVALALSGCGQAADDFARLDVLLGTAAR